LFLKESITEQETEVHDIAQTSSAEDQLEGKADDVPKDSEDKDKDKGKEAEKSKEKDLDRKTEKDKEKVRALDGGNLDNLLQRLPGCVSRDLIDQLTVYTPILLSALSIFKVHYHSQATSISPG
jgi:regulator of nonsense transcripts 2